MNATSRRVTWTNWPIRLMALAFMSIALLSSCSGSPFDGLAKATTIHAVKTKAKMKALVDEAEKAYDWHYFNGVDVAIEDGSGDKGSSGSRDYIDTNNQVDGVAEGDIVKTDGYEIYYAPRYHNVIRVMSVDDNYLVSLAATIDLGNTYVDSMYLLEDYLVVIGYTYEESDPLEGGEDTICYRWWEPTGTVLVIDRTSLQVVYKLVLDSYFMDHRIIDDSLFLVSHKYIYYWDEKYEYRPAFVEVQDGETTEVNLGYDDVYYFDDTPAYGMNVLTGLKLADDPSEITYSASGYLGAGADCKKMFVDATDLYLAESNYHYDDSSYYTTMTISQYALDIELAKLEYVAAVIVNGASLNQFSMDTYDGYLRVATTDRRASWSIADIWGWTSTSQVDNHLYILRLNEESRTFDVIGHLSENLGKPGEDIKSVRFSGEVAYVVTFLRSDPLYIIDLSDPTNPEIAGEILQAGFDTYQHPWDEGHLIGIGYDADEDGAVTGMKISAYNVSEGEEEAIQTYKILTYDWSSSTSWTYGFSEALYNHKAILVSPAKGVLGFAVEAYEYGYRSTDGNDQEWYSIYHSYYYLFDIDFGRENPISEPVIIEHPVSEEYYIGVDRGVMIEDFLYTLSDNGVITYSLAEGNIVDPPLTF